MIFMLYAMTFGNTKNTFIFQQTLIRIRNLLTNRSARQHEGSPLFRRLKVRLVSLSFSGLVLIYTCAKCAICSTEKAKWMDFDGLGRT